MNGQNVGYQRVSTTLQNEARQLEGVELDIVFTDKISGSTKDRPQLKACMNHLRAGDTLHVHSIDRLARNLKDLKNIISELQNKQVAIVFHKENLTFSSDKDNPFNNLMLNMLASFAEFELSMIKERQREGIAIAQKKGTPIGRKSKLTKDDIGKIIELWQQCPDKSKIADIMGISRVTLYDFIKKHNIELN